jgi:long-chain acyl-CoA synthetase
VASFSVLTSQSPFLSKLALSSTGRWAVAHRPFLWRLLFCSLSGNSLLYIPIMTRSAADTQAKRGNLFTLFQQNAEHMGDRVALVSQGGRGDQYTYAEVMELSLRLAAGLADGDLADCDRIGLLSENRPEWVIAYLAIVASGKTVVPIDANLKPAEINHVVTDAGLRGMFVSVPFETAIASAYPQVTLLSFDESSASSWRRIERSGPGHPKAPSEAAALIYTSGTTGVPKVAVLTHQNLISNLGGVRQALHFDTNDVFLSVLPLHHTFETTCDFLAPITMGCKIVYARSLKSKEILEDLGASSATIMCGVPLLFEKMYQSIIRKVREAPLHRRVMFSSLLFLSGIGWRLGQKWGRGLFASIRNRAGLGSIRLLVSGGAPLPPEIAEFFNLIGLDFLQGYGLTECSPVVSVNRPEDIRFGSVGPLLPNLQIKILEADDDGIGEILIKGDSVMVGYLNNPELNAKVFRDGWFHTGDLGHVRDGHLWITGRKKNVIVSAAGKNIHPEELEEKLCINPFVLEAVVYGRKKDGKQGEEVRAIIVPDMEQFKAQFGTSEHGTSPEHVEKVIARAVADLNHQVSDFKRIVGYEIQLQELEKTSSKKIRRVKYAHQ